MIAVAWYDANAEAVTKRYEELSPEDLHSWLLNLLPPPKATILDVGAGSGRDAAWISSKGYDVVAVEPSTAMRAWAVHLHPDAAVQWIDDALPGLTTITRAGMTFDVILLNAVWMHVAAADRARAFRKLINLLRPGGLIALTLRHGAAEPERGIHAVPLWELENLARDHGAFVEFTSDSEDQLGRADVRWTHVAIRLPDDGTGALPLLRHVILNDDKSSTYKLALLRALCRIADGAAGFAREHDEDYVAVPLGLVALMWIRLYKPLLRQQLPQNPINVGLDGLGFVKAGFRNLTHVSHLDLRVGMRFLGETGATLHNALRDAVATIARMPATYMTYPNGGPVFPVRRSARARRPSAVLLDQAYLSSFGELLVPRHLWKALQRLDAWIEPALVAEWSRLVRLYADRQRQRVDEAILAAAMVWDDPSRDVAVARQQAIRLSNERQLFCVWSGRRLTGLSLDLDHCFPWSAWPCGDLWNLLPAHRTVNQQEKRARLPSDRLLRTAGARMIEWWESAYLTCDARLTERFWIEASSSLPTVKMTCSTVGDLFDAVCLRRTRLSHDQQVPEWPGEKYFTSSWEMRDEKALRSSSGVVLPRQSP